LEALRELGGAIGLRRLRLGPAVGRAAGAGVVGATPLALVWLRRRLATLAALPCIVSVGSVPIGKHDAHVLPVVVNVRALATPFVDLVEALRALGRVVVEAERAVLVLTLPERDPPARGRDALRVGGSGETREQDDDALHC